MDLGLGSTAVKRGARAAGRRKGVELGFSLPSRGPLARVDVLTRLARTADALGFSVVTISDHIVLPTRSSAPYPYDSTGAFPGGAQQPYLEPIPTAAWLLAVTRRLRVGISVLVVPYRNPVVTAKQLATIDAMSGGRLIVGAGVGWWPEEFEALAAPAFAERGAVTDEYLRLMKTLWTEDDPRFDGKHYRLADVTMLPKPVQKPHPPIWIGGHTEPALRRTALLGDAWHPIGLRGPAGLAPEELAEKVARIRTLARAAGRDPAAIRVAFRGPIDLWPARGRAPAGPERPLAGPPAKVVADIRAYEAAGVDTFVFDLAWSEPAAMAAVMRRVAREIRPRLTRPARPAASRAR
jgi:probable F420-dependent oxidoreductase